MSNFAEDNHKRWKHLQLVPKATPSQAEYESWCKRKTLNDVTPEEWDEAARKWLREARASVAKLREWPDDPSAA